MMARVRGRLIHVTLPPLEPIARMAAEELDALLCEAISRDREVKSLRAT